MPQVNINHFIAIKNEMLVSSFVLLFASLVHFRLPSVIQYTADCLQRYEEYVTGPKSRFVVRLPHGLSLTCLYFFIKCLQLGNVLLQLLFLQYFLSYHQIRFIQYSWSSLTLSESELFPRMTLCDFQIRELGERHFYTVECLLTINIFIEKIYFFIWIWLTILFVLTLFEILRLILRLTFRHSRKRFIHENLELLLTSDLHKEILFRSFPLDNFLALIILAANSSPLIVAEVLGELLRRKLQTNADV